MNRKKLYPQPFRRKGIVPLLLAGLFLLPHFLQGQNTPQPIRLKNGVLTGTRNILYQRLKRDSLSSVHYKQRYYVLLQFDRLPGPAEKKELSTAGIHLFDYVPGNAFLAEIPEDFSPAGLERYRVSGLHPLSPGLKIDRQLRETPDAVDHGRDFVAAVSYFGTLDAAEVRREIERSGARIVPSKMQPDHILFVQAVPAVLDKIAALPFVSYLGIQSIKAFPLNYYERAAHGVNAIAAESGRNLQGRGVTIGIGDNADPFTHVDFTGRLIERFSGPVDFHGTHVSGTAAGAGILNPVCRGMAPKAILISQLFSDIIANAPTYLADNHMVLTNNSYSVYPNGCLYEGEYDALSSYIDAQMIQYPNLLHDFAAGNDGAKTCTPFPPFFGSVKSGFQSAKNVLTIGNGDNLNVALGVYGINSGSSRGPVLDGRIKPEIIAGGSSIYSTYPNNAYGYFSGTSQACPGATGSIALLFERYRQLHAGGDPSAALIKAIACNSATDQGNPGPDYTFGFGNLNVRAAVETMENNEYFTGALGNNGTGTYTLPGIPAGAQQIKVLLYWADPAAAPFAATTLVNDLDLTVVAPDASVHRPMILNPGPGHVTENAVEGEDHLNNIEQVVINNPPAGDFTIKVSGTNIPAGPQTYFVVYQVIKPSVIVEYPYGNDTWIPGQLEVIRWSAFGSDANPFTLEYSVDNGVSWTLISNSIPGTHRFYQWAVPATATNQALIRVTRNGTGYSSVSKYNFTVLGQPAITLTNPCQGYAQLNWGAIPSATSYDILQLMGDSMQLIANTGSLSYLLGNLNRDSTYWLGVRAVNGSTPGRRSLSVSVRPSGGACALTALDKDLTVDSLIAPLTGRLFTSTALNSSATIQVEIRNLGSISTAGAYMLSYRVNGGPIVAEPIASIIPSNSTRVYSFIQPYDFSAAGIYTLQVWVENPGDPQSGNDTLTQVIKQLHNDPLVLNPSFTEGFESAQPATYILATSGMAGSDRSDFAPSNSNGRVRTWVNTGFARTGIRCATLDQIHYSLTHTSTTDSLITTFNLSGYAGTDQLWLDFYYLNHGVDFSLPGNGVWIRGNDQAAWIPVYTLDSSFSSFGVYQTSPAIDITGTLAKANPSQTISSSFQVKFSEEGYTSATSSLPDGNLDDGYSFDDITLTHSVNDIAVTGMMNPVVLNLCNLSNAEPIAVKVRNYTSTPATNIPVAYSINGVTVTESVPLVNPFDSITYTFTRKADLSAYQLYTIRSWVSYPGDTYHRNDSLLPVRIQTSPLISSYPYLEGFEGNNGYWYTDGINDSWEWGVPAKTVINKAANGSKAWVTSLTGAYNNNEQSYLYSPCFDLSGLTQPVLSFSHIFQTEDNCDCDYHWAEYSVDGMNWIKLGAMGSGTNWYDHAANQAWQLSDTRWHVSSYDIPVHPSKIRFRIVMSSDPGTNYEGIGIDDIHVFDKTPIYTGPSIGSGLTQAVSGNNWIHFDAGGRRIASINPNGQDLGNTNVKVFIYPGKVRDTNSLYYLGRDIVIQPAKVATAPVSVRLYFTDPEADSLILATGCPGCTSLPDAYQAGITQYSSPVVQEEDSTLANDSSGTFHFLTPHKDLSVLPYDNGYYAEYQVSGFSEFWVNSGIPKQSPLPLALLSFTVTKNGHTGLLQWDTKEESTTSRYLIEKSNDGSDFRKIDSVQALGNSGVTIHYQYTDKNLWSGVNYYRLKMIDQGGTFKYSPVRSITDTLPPLVIVPGIYPNPLDAGAVLTIHTSVNCRSIVLTDVSGRTLKAMAVSGMQNTFSFFGVAKGIYFLKVETDAGRQVQKILVK